jgi:NhaC family Na+:H+ antiporter
VDGALNSVPFRYALFPILALIALVVYGLILRPHVFGEPAFPLEVVFLLAATFAITQLVLLGFSWKEIERSILHKLQAALPAFFILLTIGLVIGSWMVCGTIPMLVYFGLQWIDPHFLYLMAFVVPVVFSILTGTSWGSAGAVGIVLMGIAQAMGGDLGIAAGAVVGGAYFGDKMSPLSDSTNIAAIATEVDLFDHIQSMMYTTVPSAVLAAAAYLGLGFLYPPTLDTSDLTSLRPFLESLEVMFTFHPLLLLPPLMVLVASLRRKPTVPTLVVSTLTACALALLFQRFTLGDVFQSLKSGFAVSMAPWAAESGEGGAIPAEVLTLVERGGLYALVEAVIIAFTVFFFIGALETIDAMPRVIGRLFRFARTRTATILSTLAATALTNSLTANQYATSFIVGDAFKSRYDRLGISRKVLSRSLEDTGTMLESVVPWTPTAVFMVATLGVPFAEYWHWQLLSLINFVVAPTLALLGIGCFYGETWEENAHGPQRETER